MENNPAVSVIMLTYNREQWVGRMIKCILTQTFSDFEFIIVNNGSTDSSGKIADNYAGKDFRIKVIHREKGNIGSGRNSGLDLAKGKYIAFVDDDDEVETDYLEYLYGLIVKYDADVAIGSTNVKPFSEYIENPLVMNTEEAIEKLHWRKLYVNQFITKLFKRKLFDINRFSISAKYDDIELMTYVLADAKRIVFGGKGKYIINRHENNNSAWTVNHKLLDISTLEEYLNVYRERTKFLCHRFPDKANLWHYFEWSFWISMVEKITRLELVECYDKCNELVNELRKCYEEFVNCPYHLEYENKWIKEYIYS